jgi:serine phosphatase RsbU (regulator of sigma subunit)
MAKPKIDDTAPKRSALEELALTGKTKKKVSPLNAPVWRLVLQVAVGCSIAWLIHTILGFQHPLVIWILALVLGAAWVLAIRMLFLETKLKKFWIGWLIIGFLFLFLFPVSENILILSVIFSVFFLLVRRYKPYRHLTSRRKMGFFLLGTAVFCLLTIGWVSGTAPAASKSSALFSIGRNIASYSLWSLRFFWFFSLMNLFFSVRLHFMKLKPKLAVSAFLLVIVPILILSVMGTFTIYGVLGESRAARAHMILKDWASLAAQDENFIQTISGRSFTYERDGENVVIKGERPVWFQELLSALGANESLFKELATSPQATYFGKAAELWLITLKGSGVSSVRMRGCQLDQTMMNRLATIIRSDVFLSVSNPISFSRLKESKKQEPKTIELDTIKEEVQGKYIPEEERKPAPTSASKSIWQRSLYFGMTHLDIVSLESSRLEKLQILLFLKARISDVTEELFSQKNPLGIAFLAVEISIAGLLLIFEAFALFFGLRITSGITSAVKALHRGTRRIAAGDLETEIEIPNEDELGDLAASFNEMARAVKRGREQAVAREQLERELKVAREIQERLLPHSMPQFPGFEISGTSLPSQQVGGDYFDFLDMDTGKLGIAIADVSGKGIPAALLMANLQASLHGLAFESEDVAEAVFRINNLLYRSTDSHMFATFFYGILDRNKLTFTSTNAGHNPPLLFRANGRIERLNAGGLLLGFMPDQQYAQQTVQLEAGEVIILYTDGITEAVRPSAEGSEEKFFGEERLIEVIRANMKRSASEIQAAILKAISEYIENIAQNDDITLVVIKRREPLK